MKKHKTVFVGMSGGVDSSVTALRLKKQGYNVVGVFIKVWHPEFMVCNWEEERLDAMRVAAHLEIPFLTCDAEAEYRDNVAHYFIEEYKAGRTPNPDVMCNKEVKFGAFLRFAEQKGADFIATGHYATRIEKEGEVEMHRGCDTNKDQTYFLWTLTQAQLKKVLFPVGNSEKEIVRKEAIVAKLPVAEKKDSQGICFLGHVDIPEFISHYTTLHAGDVLDTTGHVVGRHQGALIYTLGQRHGFTLYNNTVSQQPHYVTARDIEKNTITVATEKPFLKKSDTIELTNVNVLVSLEQNQKIEAQFRYRQKPFTVHVEKQQDNRLSLKLEDDTEQPAVGQSCVLYQGTRCIGGGIIT